MRGGCFGVTIGIGGCGVAETLPSLRSTLPHTGGLLPILMRVGSSQVRGSRTMNRGGPFDGHPSNSFPNSPSRNPNTAPSGGKLLFFNVAWGAMSSKTK